MKSNLHNKYGYKVCCKSRKTGYTTRFLTHSFKKAVYVKKTYQAYPLTPHKNKQHLTWHIIPITKKEVKSGIWRQSPF